MPGAEERTSGGSYATGLGYGFLSFGTTAFLTLVASVATARLFGVRTVGEFALASAPSASLWFLSSIREQVALVRELATLPPRAPRITGLWMAVFSFSFALTLVVSILAAGVTYVVYHGPIDQPQLFWPAVACLATNVLFQNTSANLDGVFSAFVAGRTLYWLRVHEVGLVLVMSVAAGVLHPTLWALVAANCLPMITPMLHRVVAVRRYMAWRPQRAALRYGYRQLPGMLRWSVRMAPGTVLAGLANQTATWLLGALSTVATVGAFNRAQMVAARFQQLTIRIVQMLFPTLVARRASGDHRGFDRALVETMRYTTVVTLLVPSVGGGAAVAVMSIFGSGFGAASDALALLLLTPTLANLAGVQAYGLYAVDRPGLVSWITALRFGVTVAVGVPATLALGLQGPAIGMVAGLSADVWCKQLFLRRHLVTPLHTLWSPRHMLGLLASAVAGYVAARALTEVIPYPLGLPVILLGGTVAYAVVYMGLVGLTERDLDRIQALRERLTRRRSRSVVAASKS